MAVTNQMVAPRYAKALFEVAQAQNGLDLTQADLTQLNTVIDATPDLLPALAGKDLDQSAKETLLALLKRDASPLVQQLIDVVFVNGRIGGLVAIIEAFTKRYEETAGIVNATVTTAVPLDDQQAQAMQQAIAQRFDGSAVRLTQVVDPSIIGGVKVVSDDRIIDGTVATRLVKLQKQLLTN
ncbi:ATP synthase F1 subunit delta [Lacticaseibacillus daqingensis]|uniref:ATP synthase F1 subunit delta n=1 Tax=Lacticaseibacillus daqingensis TaxID=2486014 RepID=UPI0013DE165B|nr:ATP synthase F1 subunit delta [Lacticaseibacillus daqingensis]